MKQIYCIFFCWISCFTLEAQPLPDSVRTLYNAAKNDIEKGKILVSYVDLNTDKDTLLNYLIFLQKYFEEKKEPVIVDYIQMAVCRQLSRGAQYAEAINELYRLMPRFENRNDGYGIMVCNRHFSYAYYASGDSVKALYYDRITVKQSEALGTKNDIVVAYNNLAADMAEYGHFDSAFYFAQNAVKLAQEINDPLLISKTFSTTAEGYIAIRQYDSALHYIRRSIPLASIYSKLDYVYGLNDFAQVYLATHHPDSAIYFATRAVDVATRISLMNQVLRAYQYLSIAYKQTGPLDSAYKYLELTVNTKDSMYGVEKVRQVQVINSREQNRVQEAAQQKIELKNKIKIYSLLAGLAVFSFIGFILFRNSRKEKNAKILLQKKNELIEKTLGDLKSTQSQLIQSEKMASLGELTAGIAHEIQNPLNFVNNFSDVNIELLEELKEEITKGNLDEVVALANDVIGNEEKINHHGKRADAIVKGMLQHSQTSSGKKELVNINKLADEYLRLAYHGIRAKDNSFNATLKTDYDESIGNISIIPQDIGRVLLNLITNAFYAVEEKRRQIADYVQSTTGFRYDPAVSVTTKKTVDRVVINISDNGNGMPKNIIDKIFQPFFTTKPTGQGTGLGLSLAYDIIKAHNGNISVENSVDGATFKIELPVN